jgi:NlpC/P60 family putative phage cell wall peptidase
MPDRRTIIVEARSWIGTPYRHQASLKGVGCDCLGLVRGIWRDVFGCEPEIPPPYTRDWAEAHGRETLAEAAARHMVALDPTAMRPGNVILFAFAPHVPAKHCAKGGGGGVETTTYSYYANFAVGLCEGVIDHVGRIWADGNPLDMTNVTMRVYRGSADQQPDSLIEAIEGAGNAPAYRGTAYVVFDKLAIGDFGNRIPQLNFEVFRRVSPSDGTGLEDLIQAITIIPGAGEFVYDTEIDSRDLGGGASAPENDFAGQAEADWSVAMDDLQASLPNVNSASLVVSWFGDDLRAGHCTVRPKVETGTKSTRPNSWTVHGVTREEAQVGSTVDGRPAYGGTPSDDTVVHAIRDLKARGLSVTFYPFLSMDIPNGNTLPDPWTGETGQPVYPWRGRITCDPAPGQPDTVDKTEAAAPATT